MKSIYSMVLTSWLWSTTMGILGLTGRNAMSIFRLFVLWANMTVGQILFCTLIPYNFFLVSNCHNTENLRLRLFTEFSWPVNSAPQLCEDILGNYVKMQTNLYDQGKKVRLEPYTAHITTCSFRKCTSLSFRAKVLLHFPASYLLTYLPNQNNLINVKTKLIGYFKLS